MENNEDFSIEINADLGELFAKDDGGNPPIDPKVEVDDDTPPDDEEPQEPIDHQDDDEPIDPPEDNENPDPLLVENFNYLREKGFFQNLPEDYEFKGTESEWEEVVNSQQEGMFQSIHDEYLKQLQSNQRASKLLDYLIKTGGEDLDGWMDIQKLDEISPDKLEGNEDLQKEIVKKDYKAMGLTDDEIEEKIDDLELFDKLEKESKRSAERLNRRKEEKEKQFIQNAEKQKELKLENERKQLEKLRTVANEMSLPGDRKEKVLASLINPIQTEEYGTTNYFGLQLEKIRRNPKAIIQLASILLDYNDETGDFALSGLSKKATEKTKKFRERLQSASQGGGLYKQSRGGSGRTPNIDPSKLTLG
jgi:hypothetical protein